MKSYEGSFESKSFKSRKAKTETSRNDLRIELIAALQPNLPIDIVHYVIKEIKSSIKFPWLELFKEENESGDLPLHIAIFEGCSFEAVKAILEAFPGAVRSKNYDNDLPLHLAVHGASTNEESLQIIELLIDQYNDGPTETGGYGYLPLHAAAQSSAPLAVVKLLLERN
jgi:hypothetical protein